MGVGLTPDRNMAGLRVKSSNQSATLVYFNGFVAFYLIVCLRPRTKHLEMMYRFLIRTYTWFCKLLIYSTRLTFVG